MILSNVYVYLTTGGTTMAKKPAMILYHTGLIVENLDDAMEKMGDALGLNWFTPRKATSPAAARPCRRWSSVWTRRDLRPPRGATSWRPGSATGS